MSDELQPTAENTVAEAPSPEPVDAYASPTGTPGDEQIANPGWDPATWHAGFLADKERHAAELAELRAQQERDRQAAAAELAAQRVADRAAQLAERHPA